MFRKLFKIIPITLLVTAIGVFISCDKELFVDDISKRKVALISPGNEAKLESNTIKFKWESIEGVENYKFQLCSPNFTSISELLYDLDTLHSELTLSLNPGIYEWRVAASNGGYQTHFSTFKLTIDSSQNLSSSQVVLSAPVDSIFTRTEIQSFSWEPLFNASEYNFRIVKGNDLLGSELFTSELSTSNNSISISKTIENGFYVWGVNAENSSSKTPYSERFLWFDNIKPSVPVVSSPNDNDIIQGGNVDFTWQTTSDNGSPIYDTLYLYGNSQLSDLIYTNMGNGVFSDSLAAGTYYWKVSRGDRCGNFAGYSNVRSFQVQ